jgi:DNA-binding XRE family transcriptional regulator
MERKKYTTFEELEDKYIGKLGTPERDEYEFNLNMEILGEKIKLFRKQQHLTQDELGKLIGVQKAQISKIEKGKSSATIATITKIFKALKAKVTLHIEFEDSTGLALS